MLSEFLSKELTGFFRFDSMLRAYSEESLNVDFVLSNPLAVTGAIIPTLLVLELLVGVVRKNAQAKTYKIALFTYAFNRAISTYVSLSVTLFLIVILQDYKLIDTSLTWYWILYGYLVWEFTHYFAHLLSHRVRLFWCFHAPHHAPEEMNLSVSYVHFFLEGPVFQLIRISGSILLGVSPELLLVVAAIAPIWGSWIHVGENIVKDGRMGLFEKFILTPSHHRIHHARNTVYIDKNYCNLFNIWDRLFGTYQEEVEGVEIEYGILRKPNTSSFIQMHFGELIALFRDVRSTSRISNKIRYFCYPPGWHPVEKTTGDSGARGGISGGVIQLD